MIMKRLLLISLLAFAGACSSQGDTAPGQSSSAAVAEPADPIPSASYAEAHAAAVAAIDYSAARGHAWSTSDALLAQAVAAAAQGDDELAIKLADNARVQAELAARQADIEEKTWQERVLSDQQFSQ
jgi:hypothetical protein